MPDVDDAWTEETFDRLNVRYDIKSKEISQIIRKNYSHLHMSTSY